MQDLISVIVPVYNVERYIEKCITSIISQTYTNLEIIVVDDGSTDKSGLLCDEWQAKDSRIKTIHKVNGGLSSARNTGINIAQGKYIAFIDSDDYIDNTMVEQLWINIKDSNAQIAICNRYYKFENEKCLLRFPYNGKKMCMNSEEAIRELVCCRYYDMSAWAKLYERTLFDSIIFPEGKLSEDYFIMYKLLDKADTICYFDTPLYYYIQRDGSISKNVQLNLDFVEAAENQMVFVENKYPNLKNAVHAAYAFSNMTVYNIVLQRHGRCERKDIQKMKRIVVDNLKYIENEDIWSNTRKIQAKLFVRCIPIYNITYRLLKYIKRV